MQHAPIAIDQRSRLTAIGLMCVAILCFSVLDATAKYLSTVSAIPVLQVVWLRFLGQVLLTLVIFGPVSYRRSLDSSRPGLQWLRGLFMLGATLFNFAAVQYLQLDQTATIFFLTPLVVAALAGPLLGEWIGWRRLLAVIAGFLGVILVIRPGSGGIHWALLLSFFSMFSFAFYALATRYLARHDAAEVTLVYSPLAGVLAMAPFALSDWVWPSGAVWLLLASLGVSGGFGHWLLIIAHRHAPAPILAPFTYISLLSMVGLGYAVFGDVPSAWTLAGGAVIIASGLYLLARERRNVG